MFNKSKDHFALNFSETKIRALKLDVSEKRVLSAGEIEILPGVIVKGHIKDKNKLTAAIKSLLDKVKIKEQFVIVGLPEDQVFVRTLTLSDLPPEEINQAIRWQADSLLPLPFEEVYLDWRLISKIDKKKNILLVAADRKLIDDYVEVLSSLSLKPVAFETRCLSLARLVRKIKPAASLVIEIEANEATLAIVQSPETLILSSSFKGEILNSDEFFHLILQMASFYQKKQKISQDFRIFITGEKTNQEIVSQITQKTHYQTVIFSPKISNFDPQKALSFASTIALAYEQIASPIDEKTINLLPPSIQGVYDQAASRKRKITWVKRYSLLTFLLLFPLGIFLFKFSKFSAELNKKIAAEQNITITSNQRQAQNQAAAINKKSQNILQLAGQRSVLTKILVELSSLIPSGITPTHLSFEEKKSILILEGRSISRDALLQLKDELEKKKQFSQVEIPLASLEKKENFSFSLIIKLAKD